MSAFSAWRRWVGITALVIAQSSLFYSCRAQTTPDASATYPVRGVVLNSLNREPIARALVEEPRGGALTDSNGRFELDLPAGFAMLSVRRPGYTLAINQLMAVQVSENTPELTLSLTPLASVTGHVSLSTSEDAGAVHVMCYRQVYQHGRRAWQFQGNADTDSEGIFRITNIVSPAAEVLVTAPSLDSAPGLLARSAVNGYAPVFYPDGAQNSSGGLFALAEGQQASLEMNLTEQPFYPVTLQVRNLPQGGSASVQVHDESGLAQGFPAEFHPQNRTAELNVPAGRYFAEILSYGTSGAQLYGRIDFTVKGAPLNGLSVALVPIDPVLVHIQKNFTVAAPAGNSGLVSPRKERNAGINLTLISTDGLGGQFAGPVPMPGSSDPELFQIQGVTPGSYWVSASANEGYVSSIMSGGVDLAREPLVVSPGTGTPAVEVTLRNDSGQIHGAIHGATSKIAGTDGGSSGGAANLASSSSGGLLFVYAIPLFPTSEIMPQTAASLGSDFSFPNLTPGAYSVIALNATEISSAAPEVLARYISQGQSVTVEANGSATVALDGVSATDGGAQ